MGDAALADHEAEMIAMRAAMDTDDALARCDREETSPHVIESRSCSPASSFEQVRDARTHGLCSTHRNHTTVRRDFDHGLPPSLFGPRATAGGLGLALHSELDTSPAVRNGV